MLMMKLMSVRMLLMMLIAVLTALCVCRKKIMMILCVLISAPLGTWMGLKYIGIM